VHAFSPLEVMHVSTACCLCMATVEVHPVLLLVHAPTLSEVPLEGALSVLCEQQVLAASQPCMPSTP
jgi:hypothetical protein